MCECVSVCASVFVCVYVCVCVSVCAYFIRRTLLIDRLIDR